MDINDILDTFAAELRETEAFMRKAFPSDIPTIPQVVDHVISSGGKRFRPLLLLATASLWDYEGADRFAFAGVMEFIHTATLLHDDVVDDAAMRRGKEAANKKWGNAASVLVGDFLLARSMLVLAARGDGEIFRIVSQVLRLMSEGELLQLLRRGRVETNEEDYLRIVRGKTAALTSACCEVGARLAGASPEQCATLAEIGASIGVVFQITDDVLDYSASGEEMGKEVLKDICEGKMTLPLIHAFKNAPAPEKEFIKGVIVRGAASAEDMERLASLVARCGGVEYAHDVAQRHVQHAQQLLGVFPPHPARIALAGLAAYAAARRR